VREGEARRQRTRRRSNVKGKREGLGDKTTRRSATRGGGRAKGGGGHTHRSHARGHASSQGRCPWPEPRP
jgi:hypothetical protein